MIVDLHAHYPMHLISDSAFRQMMRFRGRPWKDWYRVLVLKLANLVANYEEGEPTVTIDTLRAGNVGIVLSMLYAPFDEMDTEKSYGAPPDPAYIKDLFHQIHLVEKEIDTKHAGQAVVARNQTQLNAALAAGKVALVHAVEGGFHVGDTADTVRANVHLLAEKGVAYITVAHLFWRQIATNANAIPFLSDWLYRLLFPEPADPLGELGVALIEAMVKEHVLVDVTHMSDVATTATLALLDDLDPTKTVPVIAGHAACLFGSLEYNIDDSHIEAIASRQGVIGLIAGTHYMADGLPKPKTFDESMEVILKHIDHLHTVTGSHDFTAFGSDFDGFIKPTLPGLETPAAFARVEQSLVQKYGTNSAEKMCSGNALRVLKYWGQ
jgi:microsomal dipeptidase-like Zn-dependent dipeptidase